MRVVNDKWFIASRDLYHASCEHCLKLSMAIAAGSEWAIQAKTGYEEPKEKLIFIQGAEYEDIRFAELKAGLPAGDFVELPPRATKEQTKELLDQRVPIIAQAYLEVEYPDATLTGYADLLVREDYELVFLDGRLVGKQIDSNGTKYSVYDIKHSDKPKDIYWLQLASYHEALSNLGLNSNKPLGIIGVKNIFTSDCTESLDNLRKLRVPLFHLLQQNTPAVAALWRDLDLHCPQPATCDKIFCEYPKLCVADRNNLDLFSQLYRNGGSSAHKLNTHGITTVKQLAQLSDDAELDEIDPVKLKQLISEARLIDNEKNGKEPQYLKKATANKEIPEPSAGDLFFDLEWYTPVLGQRLNYIFGSVDHDGKFYDITAKSIPEERQAFLDFVTLVQTRLAAHPDMHVYHWDNPERLGMNYLVEKHGILENEVEVILSRFVDLKPIAIDHVVVGIGGYSLKQLEHYFPGAKKRETTTKDGSDSLLQYYKYLQALAAGEEALASKILQDIYDYNETDCISTRDAYNWLRSL